MYRSMVFAYSQVIRIAAAPDYAKIIRPSSAPFCRPMKAPHGSLLFGNIGLGRVSPYRVLLLLLSCALAPLLSDFSKRGFRNFRVRPPGSPCRRRYPTGRARGKGMDRIVGRLGER